jgi:hypothetical protein
MVADLSKVIFVRQRSMSFLCGSRSVPKDAQAERSNSARRGPVAYAGPCGDPATREPREIERRYLLGLAAMHQRVADDLAPEKPDEIQSAKIPFGRARPYEPFG